MSFVSRVGDLTGYLLSKKNQARFVYFFKDQYLRLRHLTDAQASAGNNAVDDPAPLTLSDSQSSRLDPYSFRRSVFPLVENHVIDEDGITRVTLDYELRRIHQASSYTDSFTHRSVFDRHRNRLENLSHHRTGIPVPRTRRLPVHRYIEGNTLNLYGTVNVTEGNYCHWFIDALARIFLLDKFHDLGRIDQVLVPPLRFDFQWDSLSELGFGSDRIVEMRPLKCLQFESLVASTPPRGKGSCICPDWIIDGYRSAFSSQLANTASMAGKRVYVSRRDAPSRMFINEDEVCRALDQRGFDIVELTGQDLWNKIAVFNQADLIVSQTGAGLTNLMFCSPGAHVLELINEDFIDPLWSSIAYQTRATHHPLYYSKGNPGGGKFSVATKSSIDIDALLRSIDKLEMAQDFL